jgi:preprotein translocase subunit SecA
LETAVRAHALYHKDKEYVVTDNEIIIVDTFYWTIAARPPMVRRLASGY